MLFDSNICDLVRIATAEEATALGYIKNPLSRKTTDEIYRYTGLTDHFSHTSLWVKESTGWFIWNPPWLNKLVHSYNYGREIEALLLQHNQACKDGNIALQESIQVHIELMLESEG